MIGVRVALVAEWGFEFEHEMKWRLSRCGGATWGLGAVVHRGQDLLFDPVLVLAEQSAITAPYQSQ